MPTSSPMAKGSRVLAAFAFCFYLGGPLIWYPLCRAVGLGYEVAVAVEAAVLPMGLLGLGCLLLSLLLPEDRDWRGVDRTFAIPITLSAIIATILLVSRLPREGESIVYTVETWWILWCWSALIASTVLVTAVAFWTSARIAVAPLLILLFTWAMPISQGLPPDSAEYIQQQVQDNRAEAFHEVAGNDFWGAYWQTQSPEDVRSLFGKLTEPQREALARVLGREGVTELVATGDDADFLSEFGFGQTRDEAGNFTEHIVRVHRSGVGSALAGPRGRDVWFFYVALAYALWRWAMSVYRWRKGKACDGDVIE